jgi:hypothetical protein
MSGTDVVRNRSLKICDEIAIVQKHAEPMIIGITAAIVDGRMAPTPPAKSINSTQTVSPLIFDRFGPVYQEACSAFIETWLGCNPRIWLCYAVKITPNRTSTLCLLD